MVDSVSGASASLISSVMASAQARQNADVTMLKKIMDNEQAQGEAALKLIDTAGDSGRIDVYA